MQESMGREQIELMLHVAPCLFCNNGIWVGMHKSTSVTAGVTGCLRTSWQLSTPNSVHLVPGARKLQPCTVL